MSRSKATIALMRLKEIDEKYQKSRFASIDIDSSTSDTSKSNSKITVPKFKLEIKLPRTMQENDQFSLIDKPNETDEKLESHSIESIKNVQIQSEVVNIKRNETFEKGDHYDEGSDKSSSNSEILQTEERMINSKENIKNETSTSIILTVDEYDETNSEGSLVKSEKQVVETHREEFNDLDVDSNKNSLDCTIDSTISSFVANEKIKDKSSNEIDNTDEKVPTGTVDFQKLFYEDDTFEEDSNSMILSSWKTLDSVNNLSNKEIINNGKIISLGESVTMNEIIQSQKDSDCELPEHEEFIEILAPKSMYRTSECQVGLDKKLSKYVEIFERIDDKVEPIRPNKCKKKIKKRNDKLERTNKNIGSTDEEKIYFTSNSESTKKTIISCDDEKLSNVSSIKKQLPRVSDGELLPKEKFNRELFQITKIKGKKQKGVDVTRKLVKLNREALQAIKKQDHLRRNDTIRDKSRKTVVTNHRPRNKINDDQHNTEHHASSKNKQDVVKPTNAPKKKVKYSGFGKKKIHRFNKQFTTLQLQEEKNRIFHYPNSLERTRSGLKSFATIGGSNCEKTNILPPFSPLDFPKIAEFHESDPIESQANYLDARMELQKKLIAIRQWLKDQFILYRDYSDMAFEINAEYVPVTLDETRRMIRETIAKKAWI